jgi:hypothetical protein
MSESKPKTHTEKTLLTGSAERLFSDSDILAIGRVQTMRLYAPSDNSDEIMVGDSSTSPTRGAILYPGGEPIAITGDGGIKGRAADLSLDDFYVIGVPGDKIQFFFLAKV